MSHRLRLTMEGSVTTEPSNSQLTQWRIVSATSQLHYMWLTLKW